MRSSISSDVELRKPMYLSNSLLWFGGWAATFILSVYVLMPRLSDSLSEFERFSVSMTLPLVLMFITAIVIYRIQYGRSLQGFKTSYRIHHIRLMDIVWGIIISVIAMACMGAFSALSNYLISLGIIPVPNNLPLILNPNAEFNHATLSHMVGGQILGNWRVIVIYFIMLFFNITAEELLWRGYILPRQELAYGKKAWLIHGLLWTLFHSFKWWDMISLLPVCLLISYIAQKRQSIWPGFIAHYIVNGMGLIMFLAAVLGVL